jgi:hypothetical protein
MKALKVLLALGLSAFALPAFAVNTCYVTEYARVVEDDAGKTVPVASTIQTTQSVVYTTSTAVTNAFSQSTTFVRIICTATAYFAFGASPTATAASPYLPANTVEYFGVTKGQKVAFYDGSS